MRKSSCLNNTCYNTISLWHTSWTSMFNQATFQEIHFPSSGNLNDYVAHIPYFEVTREKLRRIHRSHKIRSTFYTEKTLRKLLCKPKGWVATEDKNNIVYEIDWNNCEAVYFGESNRSLKSRLHERSPVIFRTLLNPGIFRTLVYSEQPETHSEPCKISRMEHFAKIVNGYNYLGKLLSHNQLSTFSTLWNKYRHFFKCRSHFRSRSIYCT